MSPVTTLLSRDANQEIAALIETLHTTEQRLEALTAGEVDAVADRDGRTLLLREAQEQLRHIEAGRQASILNALPAHIALLDRQGVIVSVNSEWRRFAGANALLSPNHCVGVNYLETCDRAQGVDSAEAKPAAAGIRAVLGGATDRFSMEYPCHSPTQQRWFLLTVTPLADVHSHGAVVMHVDVSQEHRIEEELLVSEARFRQMADNITDVFFLQNLDSTEIYYVSPAYEKIWGRTCKSLYLNPRSWIDAFHPDDVRPALQQLKEGSAFDYEYRILRPDGEMRWIHARGFPINDATGRPYRIAGVCTDVTQQKFAVDQLRESEGLKRAILESSLECIITIDHEGKILEFNAAAEKTFGLKRNQVLGKIMAELIVPPRLRAAHGRGFEHYIATGDGPMLGKRVELAAIRADGDEFPVELTVTAIVGGQKPMFAGFIRDITVQQADQSRLRESESRFRSLTNLSSDWFWEQDEEYRFTKFSGGEQEGRLRPDQLVTHGLRRWELPGVMPAEGDWNEHKDLHELRKSFRNFEYQRILRDGTVKFISASGEPVFDAGGRFTGYRGVASDITARKRADQALLASELLFRQMAENINDVFFLKDAESNRMLYISPAYESITGLSIESMYADADAWTVAVHPDDRAMVDEKYREGKRTGTFAYEYRLVRPDGAIRWIETRGFPVRDEAGKLVRIAGIAKDITDRRGLETESLRFVEAMNATQDAIYLVDRATMRFIHVNDAACRMLSLTRAELLELAPEALLSDSREELEHTYDEVIASGAPSTPIEMLRTREDGTEVWIELRRQPRRFADGWLVITMVRDITERKLVEEVLRKTQEQERERSLQLETERARLVSAQQVAKVGSWQTDLVTMTVVWSAETHRIFETDPATFQPSHQAFLESVHPDDRAQVDAAFGQSLVQRSADYHLEHRLLLPDGRIKFIEERWRVQFDDTETPVLVEGTCQDISERKHGEMALRDSEEKFRQLADHIDDTFWIRSPDLSEVQYVSPAFEKIWGRSIESLRSNPKQWADFILPEDRARVLDAYASLADRSPSIDLEYRIVRPDGEIRWVRVRGSRIMDGSGKLIRLAGIVSDITERVKVDEALQRQHTELKTLFDMMPAMIWFKDTGDRILRINQLAAEGAGKAAAEIEGRLGIEIYPSEGAHFFADDLQVIASGKPKLGAVEKYPVAGGKDRWVQTDKVPYLDANGKIVGIIAMATDITERKLAGETMQRQHAELRVLFDLMPAMIWFKDTENRILLVNQHVADAAHKTISEIEGRASIEIYPADAAKYYADDLSVIQSGQPRLGVVETLVGVDGGQIWVQTDKVPYFDNAGKVVGIVVMAQDITERRKVAKALEEGRDRLALATESARIGIWDWDVHANRMTWDAQMYALYGIRSQDFSGAYDAWQSGLHPEDRDRAEAEIAAALAGSRDFQSEFRVVWPNGEVHYIEAHAVVQRTDDGLATRMIGVNWDVSLRRRAELDVHSLNVSLENRVIERTAELEAANKELEAFDYSVAHDLMAPIRHITGFSGILTEEYGDKLDARGRDLLKRMQGAGYRMDQLVGDLLALSLVSRREINRTRIDLSSMAQLVCAGLRQAQPGRDVECVVAPGLTAIADLGQIRIVLENLIGNAMKFTSKRRDAKIEFGCDATDAMPVYFVRDNGAGFDATYADRLFTPFQRLHTASEFAGTGIGLATVMRIIARHGGKLWAEGEVDKGATFYFTLPS